MKNLRFYDSFLLLFFLDNEISFTQVGILYAAREISTNTLEIPSGLIADIYGRKKSLLLAFLIYIASFIMFYFSTNFNLLLVGMAMIGISDAFRSGTHKGMIMDYLKINNWSNFKVDYYGHTRSWSQLGSAISALVAGAIVFYAADYRIVYLVAIIPYLLNVINIFTYPNELNLSKNKRTKGRKPIKIFISTLISSFKDKEVLKLVNSSALHSAYLKSIKDYIQPLMVHIAILIPIASQVDSKSKNGLVVGGLYFFIYLMTSYASKSSGKVLALKLRSIEMKTLIMGLLAGLSCGVLFYYKLWIPTLLIFILIFIIENIRKPILTGFLSDNVSNEILTSIISIQSFYNTIMTAIISILLGVLADCFGIGISLVITSIFLILITILIDIFGSKEVT